MYQQGKKINRVACGSAHTLAWSTNRAVSTGRLPSQVPMEYDLLKEIPLHSLRNRLVSIIIVGVCVFRSCLSNDVPFSFFSLQIVLSFQDP